MASPERVLMTSFVLLAIDGLFDLLLPFKQQDSALIILFMAHYFNFITTVWFHPFI